MPARTANRAPASLPERARTSWSGCRGSRVTGGGRTPAAPLPPPRAAPVRSRARGDGCRWRTDESSRSLRRTAARPWPRARRRWFRTWHRSPRERTAARRARAARDVGGGRVVGAAFARFWRGGRRRRAAAAPCAPPRPAAPPGVGRRGGVPRAAFRCWGGWWCGPCVWQFYYFYFPWLVRRAPF